VEFLGARVRTAETPDPLKIQALRSQFTDANFDVRELAARTLSDLGIELRAEDWLALRRPDPIARLVRSAVFISPDGKVVTERPTIFLPPPVLRPLPERLRTSRAVLALRRGKSPEALQLLETLADGAPTSPLTIEAKAALSHRK